MTNGEKLIKEYPGFVAHCLAKECDMFGECESCPLRETDNCDNEKEIEKWLKEETKE